MNVSKSVTSTMQLSTGITWPFSDSQDTLGYTDFISRHNYSNKPTWAYLVTKHNNNAGRVISAMQLWPHNERWTRCMLTLSFVEQLICAAQTSILIEHNKSTKHSKQPMCYPVQLQHQQQMISVMQCIKMKLEALYRFDEYCHSNRTANGCCQHHGNRLVNIPMLRRAKYQYSACHVWI